MVWHVRCCNVVGAGDVNKKDFYKNTALHRAACMGYTQIVKLLVEQGADVDAQAKVMTACTCLDVCNILHELYIQHNCISLCAKIVS
jgi:ankyrin repeat protein